MYDESIKNPAENSILAVKQYIMLKSENGDRHQANILVRTNGKDFFPGVLIVFVKANQNIAEVIIENLPIYGGCPNTFTTENSSFFLIRNTLQIKSKDTLGLPLTVEITAI